MNRQYAAVAVLILAVVAVGFYVHTRNTNVRAPLAFCVIAAALITFFWFLSRSKVSSAGPFDDGALRQAIAASVVVEYLVLVGTFAFWGEGSAPLPPMTALLIPSFTSIVGVVVAFYFGASAFVEARTRGQGGEGTQGRNQSISAAQPSRAQGH